MYNSKENLLLIVAELIDLLRDAIRRLCTLWNLEADGAPYPPHLDFRKLCEHVALVIHRVINYYPSMHDYVGGKNEAR